MVFITTLFWFIIALLFALLEIESEGSMGGRKSLKRGIELRTIILNCCHT